MKVNIISTDLYDEVDNALEKIFSAQNENSVVLAAGEPSIIVPEKCGQGGQKFAYGT